MSAEDKMKNAAQDISGKAKESMGKLTGDEAKEAEGKLDQAKASLKKAGENVKDALK